MKGAISRVPPATSSKTQRSFAPIGALARKGKQEGWTPWSGWSCPWCCSPSTLLPTCQARSPCPLLEKGDIGSRLGGLSGSSSGEKLGHGAI